MHRFGLPLPRRVAVLRALQLGDMLCAVPAFRALRAALPEADIVLIGLPWARRFAERFSHCFNGFREFPGFPGMPERPADVARIPAFLQAMQQERFDLVIQMHGSGGLSNPLTIMLGASRCAGYFVPGQFCPDPERFLPYPDSLPEVRRHLRLMEFLGAPLQGEELEFPLLPEDWQGLRALMRAEGLRPGSYVCLHPGARAAVRRWPPECFAAVGDALASRGLRVVLTGTGEEAVLTRAVAGAMRAPALDLAGRQSLGAMTALYREARLLVCNNTGVSHLAAAVRVPSVVFFHEQPELDRWAALDRRRHRPVCNPAGVSAEEVLAQAEDLLKEGVDATHGTTGRPPRAASEPAERLPRAAANHATSLLPAN